MEEVSQTIGERLAAVRRTVAAACQRAGRPPDAVTLVAVSKTQPPARVLEAAAAGVQHFGENRVEEALGKIAQVNAALAGPVSWHMVGHVQSRKARYVVRDFALLHSLDSVRLAGRLSRALTETGRALDVLLEMNVSGEASKEGWDARRWAEDGALRRALWDDVAAVLAMPGLRVRGLMTMAPIVDDMEQARPVFAALRGLRDALAADFPGAQWDALSMGMTDDYPVAIEEGATLVRIGRAIFGPRL